MSDNSTLCPICGEGHLIEHTHDLAAEIEGYSYVVDGLLHSICDHCDEYITTPDQSRHNKRVIIAARDQAGGECLRPTGGEGGVDYPGLDQN